MFEELNLFEFHKEKLRKIYDYLYSKEEELINNLKKLIEKYHLTEENNNYQSLCFEIMNPAYYYDSYAIFCILLNKEFDDINNEFITENIPEKIEYEEERIEKEINNFIISDYDKRYNLFFKTLNNFYFPWFAKCWQKAGCMEVKTPSYIYFYYIGGLGFDLLAMNWSNEYERAERETKVINVGILDEEDINQIAKIPIKDEIYNLYLENEIVNAVETIEISINNNKLFINTSGNEKGLQMLEFKGFYDSLIEMNKVILNKRKLGFKVKSKINILYE